MSRTYRRIKKVSKPKYQYHNITRLLNRVRRQWTLCEDGTVCPIIMPPFSKAEKEQIKREYHMDGRFTSDPTGAPEANRFERRNAKEELRKFKRDPEHVEVICARVKNNPYWYWY